MASGNSPTIGQGQIFQRFARVIAFADDVTFVVWSVNIYDLQYNITKCLVKIKAWCEKLFFVNQQRKHILVWISFFNSVDRKSRGEPARMERDKKLRSVIRTRFTKVVNVLDSEIRKTNADLGVIKDKFSKLKDIECKLKDLDQKMLDQMMVADAEEDALNCEIEEAEHYSDTFITLERRVRELIDSDNKIDVKSLGSSNGSLMAKSYKLPKIEMRKFDGELINWLPFWAQFEKIHEDNELHDADKFHYLVQSMQSNTRARELIESYPQTAENYANAVQALKQRYGQKDLLVEIYVRELLKLMMANVRTPPDERRSVAKLYDKLETQLRSLESLGVDIKENTAWLFPMIESCLPEDVLVAWQRSPLNNYDASKNSDSNSSSRLKNLLDFLRREVEGEERRLLARRGFEGSSPKEKLRNKFKQNSDIPTAAGLFSAKEMGCLFCENNHQSKDCITAQSMPFKDKRARIYEKRCCLKCLKPGHLAKACKRTVRCNICAKGHYVLLCPDLPCNRKEKTHVSEVVQSALANQQCTRDVTLMTLMVNIMGNNGYRRVRALLDPGSQKSYILEFTALEVKLKPVGNVNIAHSLFGGTQTETKCHKLENGLTAIETHLGWTICGPSPKKDEQTDYSSLVVISMHSINMSVDYLWDLETIGIKYPRDNLTKLEEDKIVHQHFLNTVHQLEDGRFCVGLPWLGNQEGIPSNRHIAERRLFNTTRKLRAKCIFSEYDRVFQEWLAEGVIEKVSPEDLNRKCHYLPHNPVVKANSNTTKIRPVFDASCKDKGNLSLNDCLASGPNVIEQIPAILLKFREKAIGVIADIRKAFLQIEVKEEDRDYLRFLWWKNNHQIQVFRHKRVVFGVTCSPYLLGAVILHHLKGVSSEFGALPQKLMECLYIDNCVTSVDTEAESVDLVEKSTEIFAKAKMDLRMWQFGPIHRVKEVYSRLPPSVDIERSEEASVLGMKWNLLEDTLNVTPKFGVIINSLSKRDLLSHTQQIFDPIGFLAPVLLPAKLLIQQAWTVKTDWDEPLPSTIQENFMKWYSELDTLADIKIPRRVGHGIRAHWSIHIFCDANQSAYAAAAFLRCPENKGVSVQLLMAKSRLGPLKKTTIPRMELLACMLGVRLSSGEPARMERDKKLRSVIRTRFTKVVNVLDSEIRKTNADLGVIKDKFSKLKDIECKLKDLDQKMLDQMMVADAEEDALNCEIEEAEHYSDTFITLERRVRELIDSDNKIDVKSLGSSNGSLMAKSYKLPKIEMRKFDGELINWLPFWAQFEKIHEDNELHDADKFHYLVQSMQSNTRARELIESYPQTAENYANAVQALKQRYGQKDLLVEIYVRELLKLMMANVRTPPDERRSVAKLYDKLETQLRSLESLGVDIKENTAWLFPMIESCLPEDVLVAWQRSPLNNYDASKNSDSNSSSRLKNLLDFLRREVEGEERRLLARRGFEGSSPKEKLRNKFKQNSDIPTAAGLFSAKEMGCLFCENNHQSKDCITAQSMPFKDKRARIYEKRCCLKCLKPGHLAKACKRTVRCNICAKGHYVLLCPDLPCNRKEKTHVSEVVQSALANQQCTRDVTLMTLMVNIMGNNGYRRVRALLDPGSQKSYILEFTALEVKLKPVGNVNIAHSLFGGTQTETKCHKLENGLTAIETHLGWTICGPSPKKDEQTDYSSLVVISMHSINMSVDYLWDLETIGIKYPRDNLTKLEEDKIVHQHFLNTVHQLEDGRFCVGLPWLGNQEGIPSNRHIAERRLFNTTRKLRAKCIFSEYDRVFQEWLAEGVIEKVSPEDLNRKCHYLPHNPVVKANSNTTKIRPVFDASCKDKGNLSLNDCLASGPNVIEQIPAILLKFREKAIGVIADIRKAFLQIEVKEEDRDYLRFLWWKNNHQIQVFRHKRVVFGVTCSPYLLGAVILHHLKGVSSEFGALPQKLMECLYIDNCVTSVDTEAESVDLVEKSTEIFAKAKMDLRMWQFGPIHRVKEVYSRLPPSVDIERSEEASVLGMKWNLLEDTLNVTPKFGVIINSLSKRDLLSHTQQIFDPIGFLAPVLLPAKLLIQQAWTVKTDWDEPLPSTIQENFMKWYSELDTLADIKIPRRVGHGIRAHWSIHIFCDANQSAYAAAAFLRCPENKGVSVQLLMAKSRLGPLKKTTIPRMELLACMLGVRLSRTLNGFPRRKIWPTLGDSGRREERRPKRNTRVDFGECCSGDCSFHVRIISIPLILDPFKDRD
ncbi:hypothetical protein LAZ67_21001798 [Cordylochernes scorpioides]|uniref:CCHC-type domain-containing protein n=1 Tax=Cordylochernes scorpioides TaxID=51811 RepID=A0ABY6LS72_9ARAC|nr:hypothetical protein LAZ67_21001798 [Cordylochernes scorpioides]